MERKKLFIITGCSIAIIAVVLTFFFIRKGGTAPVFDKCGDKISYQGDTYQTVQIGGQCWMRENLKAKNYRDGNPIASLNSNPKWSVDTAGAYACYQNNEENCRDSGALYNYYAVNNPAGLCPEGWSIPTNNQWLELGKSVCQSSGHDDCEDEFAFTAKTGWKGTDEASYLKSKDYQGSDGFGFSAFLSGFRNPSGPYFYLGEKGFWWTATLSGEFVYVWRMSLENQKMFLLESAKSSGFSVRCIKN